MPKETIRFEIKDTNKLEIPKVSIANALTSLRNEEFEELLSLYALFLDRDTHLGSEIGKRRMQLMSVPYYIESEDKQTKEFLESYLKKIKLSTLLFDISLAIPYGFSCIDLVYQNIQINNKTYFAPAEFYTIHPRYFRYKKENKKLLIQQSSSTQIDPIENNDKFLIHFHPSDSGDITDFALMRKALFALLLKHSVITSNMNYYENLGVPPVIIQYDTSDEKEIGDILKQVSNLRSGSMGIFPENATVTLLEGKASKTDFLDFIKYIDTCISNAVLGNTLSGNISTNGSYALAKIHDGRRKDYLSFDINLIKEGVQELLNVVLKLNFSNPKPFSFNFDNADEIDEEVQSKVYKNLEDAGFEIPVEHIEKVFKIQGIKRKEISQASEQNKKEANTKADTKSLTFVDEGLQELNTQNQNITKTFQNILQKVSSYEEAYEIIKEFDGEEFEILEDMLTKAIANTSILGEANG